MGKQVMPIESKIDSGGPDPSQVLDWVAADRLVPCAFYTLQAKGRCMPRFFVHVRNACNELSRDELGLDFPDAETAYREVLRAALEVRRELALHGRDPSGYAIEVVNASEKLIFILPFSEIHGYQDSQSPLFPTSRAATGRERLDWIIRPSADPAKLIELVRKGARRAGNGRH